MPTTSTIPRPLQLLVGVAALVIIIAGLQAAANIVVPFLLSAFIVIICAPALTWLRRLGVPMVIALLVVIGALVVIGMGILMLVSTSLSDFSSNVPLYQQQLLEQRDQLLAWLEARGMKHPDEEVLRYFDPKAAMGFITYLLSGLGGALANAFLILITVIFILLEAAGLEGKLRAVMKGSDAPMGRIRETFENVRRYMFLKAVLSIATGLLIWVWLLILGVDYAALWGLLALLLNFVPTIGSVIAAVPAVILALVQGGVGVALWTAAGYFVVNGAIGSFLEPRVVGRGLDLSPLVVFGSLVFWGWVLGPVGMLLSVPLTMTARIILEGQKETRWIAILLASRPPADSTRVLPAAGS